MTAPLVELRNEAVGYGAQGVLANVTLEVNSGDFLIIGGPNGGGKTTLLKTIAGLLPPIRGNVRADAARFGYVPQQAAVEHALPSSALEVVALGASAQLPWWRVLLGLGRTGVRRALHDCDAGEFARKPFHTLSGGQRQRVLLARALAAEPNVLLLDEPTAGVDRAAQAEPLAATLAALHRERAVAVVLVTHEFAPFLGAATRFFWVHQRRIEEIPRAEFTARQGQLEPPPTGKAEDDIG